MSSKIKWFFPQFGPEEILSVVEVLNSNFINDGAISRELEKEVASFLDCKHCLTVTSGTAALTISLMACGVGYGDEVIVPDFTFVATANAVRLTGAQVKLVDIEPYRFCIDPALVEKAITTKTKAVIAVDVNGRGADYEKLVTICKKHKLFLICDSAEALGSKYQNRFLGTFGDAGCFSFSANKTVSSGQGGMIATDNTDIYNRCLELKDQGRRYGGSGGDDLHPVIGFNFKYTNLQAAVALAQFKKISQRLEHFKNRDNLYIKYLQSCNHVSLPPLDSFSGEVRQWTDLLANDRKSVENILKENDIDYRAFWFPLHTQKPYLDKCDKFPNAIEVSKKGLWLPSSFDLKEIHVKRVSELILSLSDSLGVELENVNR